MNRESLLRTAIDCVCEDRNTSYGSPENSFATIGKLWSDYLEAAYPTRDIPVINPVDVAAMMVLLKIARAANGNKDDNWVDIAGYAACASEIQFPNGCCDHPMLYADDKPVEVRHGRD